MNYKNYVILSLIIIVLCIPRWNRQDLLISNFTGEDSRNLAEKTEYEDVNFSIDSYVYTQYVNYFNGKDVKSEISPPYTYRIMLPLIASLLPLDPLSALNLLNLIFMLFGLYFLFKLLKHLKFKDRVIFWTGFLYSFSFPVFYYGVVGLVDPPAIAMIIAGLYLLKKEWLGTLNFLLFIGVFFNEKIVVLLPVIFFYHYKNKNLKFAIISGIVQFILVLIALYFTRNLAPSASDYVWKIEFSTLFDNLSRVRTYLSLILTGGLPLILGILGKKYTSFNTPFYNSMKIGVFTVFLMIIYSLTAAYTDGRFIWYAYPFLLPIAANYIDKKLS